eukprot:2205823-Pyramimonas_sp.AAC.1
MVATQEIAFEDVMELRRLQSALDGEVFVPQPGATVTAGGDSGAAATAAAPAVDKEVVALDAEAVSDELVQAIAWWTGVRGAGRA